ncbi:MAG: ParB/RepB/Spo0J family partition protein [Phycisphaeraceae bacterium]|nr:ParB/RepB/Spo0J family partition protein [Phycisphaeraceae bacterium]
MARAAQNDTNTTQTKSRLGRGLSSLIGAPVPVEPPAPPEVPASQTTVKKELPANGAAASTRPSAPGAGGASPTPHKHSAAPASPSDQRRLAYLGLDDIAPSPFQPRMQMDEASLRELADSIRTAGVMQPIVVRFSASPSRSREGAGGGSSPPYELIAGERRWRASRLAGLELVPAVVVSIDDETAAQWALVENIQREDLNPVDKARAFRTLAERFGLSHAQIAQRMGVDRSTVANFVRLTDLEPDILDLLAHAKLTVGHAKALLSLPEGETRRLFAHSAHKGDWTVRVLEREAANELSAIAEGRADDRLAMRLERGLITGDASLVTPRAKSGGGASEPASERPAQIVSLEKSLSDHLGSKVAIKAKPGASRGRIVIEFYDLDHFDSVMEKLGYKGD